MTDPVDFNTSRNFFEYWVNEDFIESENTINKFLTDKLEYSEPGFYFVKNESDGLNAFENIFREKNAIIFPIEDKKLVPEGFEVLITSSEKDQKGDDNVIFNLLSKNIILANNDEELKNISKKISINISNIITNLKEDEKKSQIEQYNKSLIELEKQMGITDKKLLIGIEEATEEKPSTEVSKLKEKIKNLEKEVVVLKSQIKSTGANLQIVKKGETELSAALRQLDQEKANTSIKYYFRNFEKKWNLMTTIKQQ